MEPHLKPPATPADAPKEIRLSPGGALLTLVWDDGRASCLSAGVLRAASPSAGARRLRLAGLAVPPPADIAVTGLALVGHYALSITFSDGHDRGIYPWPLLHALTGPGGLGNSLTDAPPGRR